MLDTDSTNADEIARASQDTAPRLAVWFYRDRLAEGYNRDCARCQAVSYLRRKTGLSWPLAAAAFDSLTP
jgi:hypothetical protein